MISVEDVAKVLAWADGASRDEIRRAPLEVQWLDAAQQCLEDITDAY